MVNAHPEQPELQAFALGKCSDSRSAEIEHHLECCSSCCDLLDQFDGTSNDLLVDVLVGLEQAPASAGSRRPGRGELDARYDVQSLVGKGGLASVWLARDREINRHVALKQLLPGSFGDEAAQRLAKEAQVTGQLEHPNIVPVYELSTDDSPAPYYTMKLIQGRSFKDAIHTYHDHHKETAGAELEFQRLLGAFIGVCQAIAYAHSRGVIHRDLKPQNIVLGKYGEALVIDWGLARLIEPVSTADETVQGAANPTSSPPQQDEQRPATVDWNGEDVTGHVPVGVTLDFSVAPGITSSSAGTSPTYIPLASAAPIELSQEAHHSETQYGSVLGTPGFMPPEQVDGRLNELDARTDIFALGAILFELVTGRAAYEGDSAQELLSRASNEEPPQMRQVDRNIPKPLEAICSKAMAKCKEDRYAHVTDFVDDLENWRADAPISVYQESTYEAAARFARRHRTWVQATVAVLLFATIASVSAGVLVNNARLAEKEQRGKAETALGAKQTALAHKEQALKLEREARDHSVAQFYASSINAAYFAWNANDAIAAKSYLARTPEHLRGWEHDYLRAAFDFNQSTIQAHKRAIRAIAVNTDASLIVTGSEDGEVGVWNWHTHELIQMVKTHAKARIVQVAFFPDKRRLLTAGANGRVVIWDTKQFESIAEFQAGRGLTNAVICDDGRKIVTGNDNGRLTVWDGHTYKETKSLETNLKLREMSVDGTGTRVACTETLDDTVKLINLETEERTIIRSPQPLTCVTMKPDGSRLACGTVYGGLQLWDVKHKHLLARTELHRSRVNMIVMDRNWKSVLSTGSDKNLYSWRVDTMRKFCWRGHDASVISAAMTPSQRRIISGDNEGKIKIWKTNPKDMTPVRRLDQFKSGFLHALAVSPDRKWLATGSNSGRVTIWDLAEGRQHSVLRGHSKYISSLAFSPDNQHIISSSVDCTIRVWNLDGEQLTRLDGHKGSVSAIMLTEDGKHLLSGGYDKSVRFWNLKTGTEVVALKQPDFVRDVAMSPDGGKFIATVGDHIRVLDRHTGDVMLELQGHDGDVQAIVVSADGTTLASGGQDKTVRVWDLTTGKQIHLLRGHTSSISQLRMLRDGSRLFSAGVDGHVKVWEIQYGLELLSLRSHAAQLTTFSLSKDEELLLAGGFNGVITAWNPFAQ